MLQTHFGLGLFEIQVDIQMEKSKQEMYKPLWSSG